MNRQKALVILSGGQDSVTCLYWAKQMFSEVEAITFAYGQRHFVEIACAKDLCHLEGIKHTLVRIPQFSDLVNSALLDPEGDVNEINEKGLPNSFVPNRNATFITFAHAYAQTIKADALVTGVCQTDYSGYPDCRLDFINAIGYALDLGSNSDIRIETPLMYLTKAQTFKMAKELGCLTEVLEYSSTCYNGERKVLHTWGYGCGKCPACLLRKKGFEEFMVTL